MKKTLEMENKLYEPALKIAFFWTEKMQGINQNNGDTSEHGGITSILMNMASMNAQESLTEEKIIKFQNLLIDSLLELAKTKSSVLLSVDYHPCSELYDIAKECGINPGCFPCKSYTRLDVEKLKAYSKYQYGNSEREL